MLLSGCNVLIGTSTQAIQIAEEVCKSHGGYQYISEFMATVSNDRHIQVNCTDEVIIVVYPVNK